MKLQPVMILPSSKESDVLNGYRPGANSYARKPLHFGHFAEAVRNLGLYCLIVNEPPPQGGSA